MTVTMTEDKKAAAALEGQPAPRCGFCGRFTPETIQWGPDEAGCDFVRVPTGPDPDDFMMAGCCRRCGLVIESIQAVLAGGAEGAAGGLFKGMSGEALEVGRKMGAIGLLALVSAAVDQKFDQARPPDFQDLADRAMRMEGGDAETKH